jgi:hypothetical protein
MREAAQLVKSRGMARGGPRKDFASCELSVNRKLQVMEYYLAKAPNLLTVWALLRIPAAVRSISRPARHGGTVGRSAKMS